MLINQKKFDEVEEFLAQNGQLDSFESQCGRIKGRMMITLTNIPDGIKIYQIAEKKPQAFEASFDFYDSTVGLALYTDIKEAATGIWITPQKDGADAPAQEWINFFVEKLLEGIEADGSFGVPMFSFVNDTCDVTLVPQRP